MEKQCGSSFGSGLTLHRRDVRRDERPQTRFQFCRTQTGVKRNDSSRNQVVYPSDLPILRGGLAITDDLRVESDEEAFGWQADRVLRHVVSTGLV